MSADTLSTTTEHAHFQDRIKTALTMHSTKPNTFGQNIWDHLELVSVEVQAYDPQGKPIEEVEAKRLEAAPGGKRARRDARVVIEATVREGEPASPVSRGQMRVEQCFSL